MPDPSSPTSCHGATLVEVLVALGIAVIILAVIVMTHHTLTQNAESQINRMKINQRAMQTVLELQSDLHQLFYNDSFEECPVTLKNHADQLDSFSFCRWNYIAGSASLSSSQLEKITFRMERSENRYRLMRIREQITGPEDTASIRTNWLDSTWNRLLIQLHDGVSWKTNWSADADAGNSPRAARIQLLTEPQDGGLATGIVFESIVLIPSSLTVTSNISRAGSTATATP